jgi:flagellar hook-associated protein 1 FlgK
MDSYSIGLSGLDAAQKAIDVIGNNIANTATPGYHRQRIELTPGYSSQVGAIVLGGGVKVAGVSRMVDSLLEREILLQQSSLAQLSRELDSLRTIETAFGELSESSSLSAAIDDFFNALQDLSAYPGESIWQSQVLSSAEAMASHFRTLGEFLATLEAQIRLEAEQIVEKINTLTSQITDLNGQIKQIEISGAQANNLRAQRDQRITELSELIGVQTLSREYGVVDVVAGGIQVVIDTSAVELEVGLQGDDNLAITVAGAYSYITNVQGGQLGGLLSLKNSIVSDIQDDLDTLASTIIKQINQYHVQGVGSDGSFTELTGWSMTSENLADFDPPVTDGKIYIRVTNTSTEAVTRSEIDVDASTDTLTTIAAKISAVTGVTASVNSSRLTILADTNYTFDFLPAVLPEPTLTDFDDASPPTVSVSGIYTGTVNDTFRFTVKGDGSVGNGTLQLEVKDGGGAGSVVAALNIGSGYAAGDELDVGNGIKISLTTGNLAESNGDYFDVDAFGNTDTSGVLAAVGINTFFSGSGTADIAVCSDIAAAPGRIATSLGPEMTDSTNALRMAGLKEQAQSSLNDMSPGEFYGRLVTDLGQQISIKEMQEDNSELIVLNLANQKNDISGIDINDEATKLLIFEQMFQAMAKYLSTVQSSLFALMEIV